MIETDKERFTPEEYILVILVGVRGDILSDTVFTAIILVWRIH